MTEGDRSRIEVAVSHCHLVTFVRHCTFKPSFFSPSSSLQPFLLRPIVWIPLVAFYVQIGKLEGKRSSVRDSLWSHNGGLVQHLLLFCSPPLPPPSFLISSSCLPRPPLCSRRNLLVVYLHSLIPDKDKADVSPSSGQFLCPFVNETLWECLSTDVRNWRFAPNDSPAARVGSPDVPPMSRHCKWRALMASLLLFFSLLLFSNRTLRPRFLSACMVSAHGITARPLCHSNW